MVDNILADIEVASGRSPADLVLSKGRILDVFTGALIPGDLAIRGERIVAIGKGYHGLVEEDLNNRIVVPGLIDAHVHIESSLQGPGGFVDLTVPRGTTTVIADPHEIANVRGIAGIRWMLEVSENLPQSIFLMLPSCVPATKFEDSGAELTASDLKILIGHPRVLGLGEVMDYSAVAAAEKSIVEKVAMAHLAGKRIDGHSPKMSGSELAAYSVAGIGTDHECTDIEEMNEKLRMGMRILIREGTATRDLVNLINGIGGGAGRRCAFCTDDKLPSDILTEGHIDFNVREAIHHGVPPVEAIRLATLNGAETFGLEDRGALCPNRRADMVVLKGELADFTVDMVYQGGKLVAEGGKLTCKLPQSDNRPVRDTVRIARLDSSGLELKLKSKRARVISLVAGSLITENSVLEVSVNERGLFVAESDLLKLALVERHKASGRIGLGILKGYGLSGGAIASSIAHDSHNLICVGDDDAAMLAALYALEASGGGISLAATGGQLLGVLPMPLGGLMTDEASDITAKKLNELIDLAHGKLGVPEELDPFMPLSFLALPVIPNLKLTVRGLFDVQAYDFTPIDV
ncbi:Adenine deaminase [Olavius algarvensis spirochete endosymbiont]|uniref:adenine deaminase n=1 Tax=Olavius algarvensis spirochete endosymbiont TaxID=260710 RepID=UPI00052C375C|nr:adenine deaminase [Olavius algarvensis spirochete endosymbiont]KGM38449.1 hypothetical protein JY97_16190 [Alkalispirochaeta odontotermitis]VDA99394.1 Adenine deaminase [Olavius algarvensis spirochete endosymbiont]